MGAGEHDTVRILTLWVGGRGAGWPLFRFSSLSLGR